jgi:hypothetical protein
MPGTITVHNSVAADITVKLSGSSTGGNTSGKCHAGGNVTLDLTKMTGWQDGATISLSVHADGGVTRHNNAGQYHQDKDYRYKVNGTLDAFSVQGSE